VEAEQKQCKNILNSLDAVIDKIMVMRPAIAIGYAPLLYYDLFRKVICTFFASVKFAFQIYGFVATCKVLFKKNTSYKQ